MGPHSWVKTILRCARHNEQTGEICLHIEHNVQGPLRCRPSGGGGGGVSVITACGCGNGLTVSELQRRVVALLRRGGVSEWIRHGAVIVDC